MSYVKLICAVSRVEPPLTVCPSLVDCLRLPLAALDLDNRNESLSCQDGRTRGYGGIGESFGGKL